MAHKTSEDEKCDVHFVAKLDKAVYRCVTDGITTDEVIITNERIQHIKERHLEDYSRFSRYMAEIVAHPDYILEANLPNTAFVLKRIEDNGELFEMILWLKVQNAPAGYKNSVITFLRIKQKKWDK
ncbi:MAG: hypothetical protein IJ631_04385, partial [Schwartzia sp.]|nr:hypothetical protein [Schwartzia sp. (in: firmicutes)]